MHNRKRLWQTMICRCLRKPPGRGMIRHSGLIMLLVAALVAWGGIQLLELRLRPVIAEVAAAQTKNTMTAVIEGAVTQELSQTEVSYSDFVTIERDNEGAITSLTTNVTQMNLLRTQLTDCILYALDVADVSVVQVPLGTLLDFEPLWARGPSLKARAMTLGTVQTEFESEFTSSGVNQTVHRIWLKVDVPMRVLLPGGELDVPVHTRLPVAETVIVGQVPNMYLQAGSISRSK